MQESGTPERRFDPINIPSLDPWGTNFGGGYLWGGYGGYWNDPVFNEPYDFTNVGGGWGLEDSAPNASQMTSYLSLHPEFYEISENLQQKIFESPMLLEATYSFLSTGHTFERTFGLGAYDGTVIRLSEHQMSGTSATEADMLKFFHELGHYMSGIPDPTLFSPTEYATARAQAEVRASEFAVLAGTELKMGVAGAGYVMSYADEIAQGTFSQSNFNELTSAILNDQPRNLEGFLPPDYNGNGRSSNLELYLSQWVGPAGETYETWLLSQSQGQLTTGPL